MPYGLRMLPAIPLDAHIDVFATAARQAIRHDPGQSAVAVPEPHRQEPAPDLIRGRTRTQEAQPIRHDDARRHLRAPRQTSVIVGHAQPSPRRRPGSTVQQNQEREDTRHDGCRIKSGMTVVLSAPKIAPGLLNRDHGGPVPALLQPTPHLRTNERIMLLVRNAAPLGNFPFLCAHRHVRSITRTACPWKHAAFLLTSLPAVLPR